MLLSLLIIALAYFWLLQETHYLKIRLPYGSIPVPSIEQRKHSPRIELGRIINASYPKPEPIKLLAEFCYVTKLEHELTRKYFRSFATGRDSYQTMSIGGNLLTVNSHNPKLYDVIAEAVKVADSKPRKFVAKSPPLPLFVETVSIGSHRELDNNPIYKHPINRIVSDYTTIFHDCLCGKEWLEAHYNDHKDFEPTIELTVNERSISFNGNYKSGVIREFIKANK